MENLPNQEHKKEEVVICKHGENPATCQSCFTEQQPSSNFINRLQEKSSFERSDNMSANCTIESEGQRFKIEVIEDGKDPALSDVQKLLEETFGEEEVDEEEIMRSSVDGVTPWKTEDAKYRVVTIRDHENKLISVFTGSQLDLLDNDGEPTGESVYYVGYAVTSPDARQKGLAREAYISAITDAAKNAQAEGRTLKFAIGECTYTSEKFWNNVGWKRMYAQKGDKKEYGELKYIQPALDFDENTGKIAEGAGEMPEHLMIDSFGRMPPSKEDIKRAYEALTYFCVDWPEEAFNNEKAHQTQQKYLARIKTKFNRSVDGATRFIYLDAENREKAKQAGIKITEHTAADRGETGEEDF